MTTQSASYVFPSRFGVLVVLATRTCFNFIFFLLLSSTWLLRWTYVILQNNFQPGKSLSSIIHLENIWNSCFLKLFILNNFYFILNKFKIKLFLIRTEAIQRKMKLNLKLKLPIGFFYTKGNSQTVFWTVVNRGCFVIWAFQLRLSFCLTVEIMLFLC